MKKWMLGVMVILLAMTAISASVAAGLDPAYYKTDINPPSVTITSPSGGSQITLNASSVTVSGTASENSGLTKVTWYTNKGASGTCTGLQSWSAAAVPLSSGDNMVTVVAQDIAGNTGSDSIVITYSTSGTQPPTVQITSPTSSSTYSTTTNTLSIGGTASGGSGVTSVLWSNDRGGSGTCTGTSSWSASGITLQSGTNVITVTAKDSSGSTSADTLAVTYSAPGADTVIPTVAISTPTSGATYSTSNPTMDMGGTASDNVGVTSVSWSSDRGGSGTCTGTTSWSASGITLLSGSNVITVTARDAAGNTAAAKLTVTYTAPSTTPALTNVSLTPNSGSIAIGVPTSLASVYSDSNGYSHLNKCYFSLDDSPNRTNGVNLIYDSAANSLYLVNDARTDWLGGFAPGSANVIENNQCKVNCAATTVSGSGNNLTVNWSVELKQTMLGRAVSGWMYVSDDAGASKGYDNMGSFALTSQSDTTAPSVGITTPTSSTTYSTTGSSLAIGGTASDNVGVTSVSWSNDRGGSGTCTGTTSWSASGITLQSGSNVITIVAKDAAGNSSTDTLTVTYSPPATLPSPANVSLSPTSGTITIATKRSYSAKYYDANGYGYITKCYFELDNSLNTTYGVNVIYDSAANKLYLVNDTRTGWLGGYAPGSSYVIQNSQCKLYCVGTTVSKSGNYITVNWNIELKSTMLNKPINAWMYVLDKSGAYDGYDKMGSFVSSL